MMASWDMSLCANVSLMRLLMRWSVDFVYMHMDLNVLVRIRCLVPTFERLIRDRKDPLHRSLPPLAQVVRSRL